MNNNEMINQETIDSLKKGLIKALLQPMPKDDKPKQLPKELDNFWSGYSNSDLLKITNTFLVLTQLGQTAESAESAKNNSNESNDIIYI